MMRTNFNGGMPPLHGSTTFTDRTTELRMDHLAITSGKTGDRNIQYVAVARAEGDHAVVASLEPGAANPTSNHSHFHEAVAEVLAAPDFATESQPGCRFRLEGDVDAFHFAVAGDKLIYVAITKNTYPERLAFPMIDELRKRFAPTLGSRAATCLAHSLSAECRDPFAAVCADFDDPARKDKVAAVAKQVEDVKVTMEENIHGQLKNMAKATVIKGKAEQLRRTSKLFAKQATTLKNRERWQVWKLKACTTCVCLCIFAGVMLWLTGAGSSDKKNAF